MSPATKKSISGIVGIGTGIIALVAFAFTVGVNVSASTHKIEKVESRVSIVEKNLSDHVEISVCDLKDIKEDIKRIDKSLTRQTVLIESMNNHLKNGN